MSENKVGAIPEFTPEGSEEGNKEGREEVKQAPGEGEKEKEIPSEPPAEEKPAEKKEEFSPLGDNTSELEKQLTGLQSEKEKLLKEIQTLRGDRREIKEEHLKKVENKMDELKDLHPDDVNVIEKVLKAKGYVTKEEADGLFYEKTKDDQLNNFLSKYPEYKPENDKNDINWNALQRELSLYRMPTDPKKIGELLERAHKSVSQSISSDRTIPEKKQQIKNAGLGAGGSQRSSSKKSLSDDYKNHLRNGGWSEEEIKKIENNLPE